MHLLKEFLAEDPDNELLMMYHMDGHYVYATNGYASIRKPYKCDGASVCHNMRAMVEMIRHERNYEFGISAGIAPNDLIVTNDNARFDMGDFEYVLSGKMLRILMAHNPKHIIEFTRPTNSLSIAYFRVGEYNGALAPIHEPQFPCVDVEWKVLGKELT